MTKDQIIVEALKLAPDELESLVDDLSQRVTSSELRPEQLAESAFQTVDLTLECD